MKLSYALVLMMLCVTGTSAILSLIVENQFQMLGCNVSCILSMGLLICASLYAFDDYCREKHGELGAFGQLTRAVLTRI